MRFRPLENTADASRYQGQNLSDCAVEEAGTFEDPKPTDMCLARCVPRAAAVQLILTWRNPEMVL